MIRISLSAATMLASLLLAFSPAQAQTATRAWVSGHGSDAAGCGSPAAPCRSLQYVHDHIVAAGGEVDVLDPAGYGAVTISKAISIVNDGVGTAGVQAASGNAITINAGASDNVTLRGLNIDGLGTGANGIIFNSGGGLTVVNCVIRHFANTGSNTGNGILMLPASGALSFLISNVIASDNVSAGIAFAPPSGSPTVTGVIDNVTAVNNALGFAVLPAAGTSKIAMSNSTASNNADIGIDAFPAGSAALTLSIDNSSISGNAIGISSGIATILLGRSAITSNTAVGVNDSTPGTFFTYGDNRINGNGTDVENSPLTAAAQQ